MMDQDRSHPLFTRVVAARREAHMLEEEALARHEQVNDAIIELLRGIMERLDRMDQRLSTLENGRPTKSSGREHS